MSELHIPGAPAAVNTALGRLKEALQLAAGPNLAGLVLYGGLARGRFRPGQSDVNVLVLLHEASASALSAIAPALQAAWRAAAVEPMLLTLSEVPQAAHDFPTKFLDIKQHHVMLIGSDPFATLDVPRELIRLRTEQELRNMLMRLRQRFISARDDHVTLGMVLARTARPLALAFAALLQVAGRPVPDEDRTAAIFDTAAAAFGLERAPLAALAALRHDPRGAGDMPTLFGAVLDALTKAAAVADGMKEPRR